MNQSNGVWVMPMEEEGGVTDGGMDDGRDEGDQRGEAGFNK